MLTVAKFEEKKFKMVKIGINGFGRIGRLVLRAALDKGADVSNEVNLNNVIYKNILTFKKN